MYTSYMCVINLTFESLYWCASLLRSENEGECVFYPTSTPIVTTRGCVLPFLFLQLHSRKNTRKLTYLYNNCIFSLSFSCVFSIFLFSFYLFFRFSPSALCKRYRKKKILSLSRLRTLALIVMPIILFF